MSWPKVAETNDGYEEAINKNRGSNDIWWSDDITLEACKAACNSTSQCKSIAYGNQGTSVAKQCWMKRWSKDDGGAGNDSNWTTYYKIGEPANGEKRMYITKPIDSVPGNGWKDTGSLYEVNRRYLDEGECNMEAKKVGKRDEYSVARVGANCRYGNCTEKDWNTFKDLLCTRIPRSNRMCPNLGPDSNNKDLRYFRHDIISTSNVSDTNFSNYESLFTQTGTTLSGSDNQKIRCGYNRIDKSKWASLGDYFDNDTIIRIIREHCTGPGVNSRELAADSISCGRYMNKSEYNQAILEKLKTEANWFLNPTNCINFENVIIASTNDQSVMRIAGELIDTLPNTGWSDDLVRSLNSLKGNGNVPESVKSKIDPKITAYCAASNENTNEKCACRNAAVRGKAKTCAADIVGCEDVKRYTDLIDQAKKVDQKFGSQMEMIYDPNSQSDACQQTRLPTSTILRFGDVGYNKLDVSACFTEFENSGNIGGNVALRCDVAVKNYETAKSSSPSSGGSSSSSSGTEEKGTIIKGETAGVKNDYWLLVVFMCCICFVMIGIGLAAVMM